MIYILLQIPKHFKILQQCFSLFKEDLLHWSHDVSKGQQRPQDQCIYVKDKHPSKL